VRGEKVRRAMKDYALESNGEGKGGVPGQESSITILETGERKGSVLAMLLEGEVNWLQTPIQEGKREGNIILRIQKKRREI